MAMYSEFEADRDRGNFDKLPELHAVLSGMKVGTVLIEHVFASYLHVCFLFPLLACTAPTWRGDINKELSVLEEEAVLCACRL